MSRSSHVALTDLIAALALSAVDVQRIWDKASGPDVPRMFLREQLFTVALSLSASRETGFELKAHPVNLGYMLKHPHTLATCSSIALRVEQVPAPSGGPIGRR